ncbi:MAG: hypothetical protein PWR32_653 [Candidatus Woesearchaeota archaeon]|nr:hypothetical protein [Candidatus Woesearchaeota archaeon]
MVYVVWYNNSRRVFYDISQLIQFLKTVPLNSVKVFEQDSFGNMKPVDPLTLFSGRSFNKPTPDVIVHEQNVEQNIDQSVINSALNNPNSLPEVSERDLIKNSLNDANIKGANLKREKTFGSFFIKMILVIIALVLGYFLIPIILNAIFH